MLRVFILLIALGAAGGAAWLATQQTGSEPEPVAAEPPPAAIEMTAVLVASQDVARGREVTAEALRWQDWPVAAVPPAAIDRGAEPRGLGTATGQFATRDIMAGEPVGQHLLAPTAGGYLAAMLAPGKRAVAIDANTQSTAGGFILPNDRVDVLFTSQGSGQGSGARDGAGLRSRTILRGVRVLAIDQSTDQTTASTVLGKTATLELTEAQAEVVTAAQATGTLSLSLRPLNETPGEASMEIMEAPKTIRIGRGAQTEDVNIN